METSRHLNNFYLYLSLKITKTVCYDWSSNCDFFVLVNYATRKRKNIRQSVLFYLTSSIDSTKFDNGTTTTFVVGLTLNATITIGIVSLNQGAKKINFTACPLGKL